MDRGSSKHGPRPDPDGRSDADLVMTPEEVHWRSRLGTYLPRTIFPADRAELLRAARDARAPDDVLADLGQLPPAVTFANAARVWAALGHPMDQRF